MNPILYIPSSSRSSIATEDELIDLCDRLEYFQQTGDCDLGNPHVTEIIEERCLLWQAFQINAELCRIWNTAKMNRVGTMTKLNEFVK